MSNPAPTINQINAFNATQGTTIDFNIIGGTELVRSNRIYIYDLSDNSLICTHLYVSTESIHELPANTDSSIVYESGKSSADFVNGAQYYAQIQTYTDTAGTQGGSGLSVAKMFWCLVDPTLTITTIPSTISTTSYNVSATYTDTSASVVSNIIQQYQFNLYSAVGSLLQSSGVVVGSGTQQGTSDVYDISYNFTGLNVGSSYYVTVEVTTTQGMSVNAQSGTFTVSIDTPTLGEATVVNNACDGYISVTSNLSGEYGGSASGEIASFVTDSVNNISSLKVNLDPVQDLHGYDKPWVGGAGKNKLDFSSAIYDRCTLVSADTGSIKLNVTEGYFPAIILVGASIPNDVANAVLNDGSLTFEMDNNTSGRMASIVIYGTRSDGSSYQEKNTSGNKVTINCSLFSTVTRIELRPSRAGSAYTDTDTVIDGLRFSIGSDTTIFTPWENICPITGWTGCEVSKAGVNVWDEEWEVGTINTTTGADEENSLRIRSKYISVIPSTTYYLKWDTTSTGRGVWYDENKNIVSGSSSFEMNRAVTVPSNAYFLRFSPPPNYGNTYNNDISINYPSTDHDYHAYNGATYTVSWQTEAGTVYGGTVDVVSGVLTVTMVIVDLSTLTWSGSSGVKLSTSIANVVKPPSGNNVPANIIAEKYATSAVAPIASNDGKIGIETNGRIQCGLSETPSGALCYELATPQTYQLTPTQVRTLVGANNVWSDAGDVEITYNIPITNLIVKRQDVADVSGAWLTLYSQPITQASDMDFTFIDFLNQYGKTYKYALVPLLTQTQSGVEVEVEGGYTVSDEVQSVFDGVFIADSTGSQKCKANVGYGNVDMNQVVGSITPIGAQYPIIITNSQNQYHNGSISGTIVPDDYYFNGNLSRIDMVNKRSELEQFLTNKRAKIIKDWNGNIWLVMIMDNVSCTFNNNYGMGIVNFSTSWVEVGDPTNQEDLQATGLINIGGV